MCMAQIEPPVPIRNLAASAHFIHGRHGSERDVAFDQRANRLPLGTKPNYGELRAASRRN